MPFLYSFILSFILMIHGSHPAFGNEALEANLRQHILFHTDQPNTIGYIKIDDRTNGINQSTWLYVKKALEYYKKTKPAFIILELNTPGGEVTPAQQISDALKEFDTQMAIPIVAYINNWAISAGAMLAYSSRYIAVVKDGSMGAAEPVIATQTGEMQAASEKVNSALRADFANRAQFFDRNPDIAEAMVDKDIILVLRNGKIVRLEKEDDMITAGNNPDQVISRKGKLLTLGSQQLMEYGVANMLLLPERLPLITEEERNTGKWPANKELLFTHPFFKNIPQAEIDVYQMDWKTRFFAFLTTPMVSSFLFLAMMMGFYIEMSTPGIGLPGAIAITSLILLVFANFALEIASVFEVILLFIGLTIVIVDLFIFPTFGFLGFIGTALALIGFFGLLIPELHLFDWTFDSSGFDKTGEIIVERLGWLAGAFVVGLILIALMGKYVMPRFSLLNRFVLKGNEQEASEGYVSGISTASLPPVGSKGVAISELRPAGKVQVGEGIFEALSDEGYIERDTEVVIIRFDGALLIVKKTGER